MRFVTLLLFFCFITPGASLANTAGSCDVTEIIGCEKDMPDEEKQTGWTFGFGAAVAGNIPQYIGSDQSRNFILPVPYINYTSPNIKISQSGIVGKLFESDKWFLSLSLSGAIPVNSDDNKARTGMPDIEAVFEYGPSLQYYILGSEPDVNALYIDLNFREARTLSLDSLDLSASPAVVFRQQLDSRFLGGKVNWLVRYKQEFVSNSYARLFYSVEQQYATADRPQFKAKGGSGGSRISSSIRWQKGKHILLGFWAYANIKDAAYVDSPLVKTTHHSYGGFSYFKLF